MNDAGQIKQSPPRKTTREILREISPENLRRCLHDTQIMIDGELRLLIQQIARQSGVEWPGFPDRLIAAGQLLIEQAERLRATKNL